VMLELGVAVAVAGEVLIYKQRCSCNGQWHAACHRTLGRHIFFLLLSALLFGMPSNKSPSGTHLPAGVLFNHVSTNRETVVNT
jgi:hypothetical protein